MTITNLLSLFVHHAYHYSNHFHCIPTWLIYSYLIWFNLNLTNNDQIHLFRQIRPSAELLFLVALAKLALKKELKKINAYPTMFWIFQCEILSKLCSLPSTPLLNRAQRPQSGSERWLIKLSQSLKPQKTTTSCDLGILFSGESPSKMIEFPLSIETQIVVKKKKN